MNIITAKFPAIRWMALLLCCCMALPLPAQTARTGGGWRWLRRRRFRRRWWLRRRNRQVHRRRRRFHVQLEPRRIAPQTARWAPPTFTLIRTHTRVFITADDQTAAYVSQVISNMDRPKPQVLIKVVFLQVTYNNGYDVGVEGGVTKNINATTHFNASNLFGLATQGITPTTGVNTLPGAGLYTIVGNDFSATVRAIQEVGKVECPLPPDHYDPQQPAGDRRGRPECAAHHQRHLRHLRQ